jgi:NarL family two-component system response regulator LiaR
LSEMTVIKVMLVDDHPIVRDGLKSVLFAAPDLALSGEAGTGQEALDGCQDSQPDVILMDIVMPDMDGLVATRAILHQFPDIRIVVLTTYPEHDVVQEALRAGAVGYLLKNMPAEKIMAAIRTVYAGESVFASEATQSLVQLRTDSPKLGQDLTKREREVLALLVKGLTNEQIAERLAISRGTVRHHVGACISKLGASNRTHAVALAFEHRLTR